MIYGDDEHETPDKNSDDINIEMMMTTAHALFVFAGPDCLPALFAALFPFLLLKKVLPKKEQKLG